MQLPECRVTLRLYAWQVVQVYGNGCTRYLLTQHWVNFFLFFFPSFCLFVSGGLTNKHTQNPGSAGHFQIYQTSIRVRGKGVGGEGGRKYLPESGFEPGNILVQCLIQSTRPAVYTSCDANLSWLHKRLLCVVC